MTLKCRLRRVAALLTVAAVAAPGHDAFASEFKVGAITIETPWSRATPGGAKVAAGSHHQEQRGGARSSRLGDCGHCG
jgi:hypothetical protein